MGTANYRLTLPFLAVVAVVALVALAIPERMPFPPPGPPWVGRVIAVFVLALVGVFAVGAIDEAVSDPNCGDPGAAQVASMWAF